MLIRAAGDAGAPGHLLLEVDASGKDHLLQWLTRYKLRRPLTLHDASSDYQVWAAWGPSPAAAAAAAATAASPEADTGAGSEWLHVVQPRLVVARKAWVQLDRHLGGKSSMCM
jgi:folate-binding Fe-S cluster repair protein YgfZ